MLRSPLYGDEAAYYYLASTFGGSPTNVHNVNIEGWLAPYFVTMDLDGVFWQRPLFPLLLAPGALISVEAFRIVHIAYASLLAPTAYVLLRRVQPLPWIAIGVGLTTAFNPTLASWGAVAFPDTLMTVALAIAVTAMVHERHGVAAGALLAAVWVKELALPLVAGLLAFQLWKGLRRGTCRINPLKLDSTVTPYALIVPFLLIPLLYSMYAGGLFPGQGSGADLTAATDRLFMLPWLAPLIVAGLFRMSTRPLAALGLLYPVFFFVHAAIFGRDIQSWYYVAPSFFALVAAAAILGRWWPNAKTSRASQLRIGWTAVTVLVVALLTTQVVVGDGPGKRTWTTPFSGDWDPSLGESIDVQLAREPNIDMVVQALEGEDWDNLFLVDVGWFFVAYPFSTRAASLDYGYTELAEQTHQSTAYWSQLIEEENRTVVVQKIDSSLNKAIRTTYAACIKTDIQGFLVIRTTNCQGLEDALQEAWLKERTRET